MVSGATGNPAGTPVAGVRLDRWLWAARFFKTRALAKTAVAAGRIEVNGQRAKPARAVHVDDQLLVQRGDEHFRLRVCGLADQRGPAALAQALYEESAESRQHRAEQRALRVAERSGYRPPETRPDKRARRLLQALGDIDAL